MKSLEKNATVQSMLEEIKASVPAIRRKKGPDGQIIEEPGKNRKYNEKQFKKLILAILTDKDYVKSDKFKDLTGKFVKDPEGKMRKFLNKLLKHAGLKSDEEREALLETFEVTEKDVEFVFDAVDEAVFLYMDTEKTVRFMADKPMILSLSVQERPGKKSVIRRKVQYNA